MMERSLSALVSLGEASQIPARAGVGLKPEHWAQLTAKMPDIGWLEVHAENYMEAGGAPHRYLTLLRERYPLSVHGVGLSIGAAAPLDELHLSRLRTVCDRYQPGLVSEHLAWSTHDAAFLNDLLPVPYTQETLGHVCDHIDRVQTVLRRRILLENPSTYVVFDASEMSEIAFLKAIAARSGCGLLLDVNNVYVSAVNHGFDPAAYLAAFPVDLVEELHLAGHSADVDDVGNRLLIDAHDRPVADPVWGLFREAIARSGALPVLIEWDSNVPVWERLYAEARRAEAVLNEERQLRGCAI